MSTAGAWMPLYVGDYLADTMHLTAEEHGAYLLLLMHSWRNGALPDDDKKLAAIARVSLKVWRSGVGETVRAFFRPAAEWATENGENPLPVGIINPRLERERKAAVGNAARRSQAAEKAANARWSRDASRIPNADANAMRDACPPPSPNSSSSKKNTPPTPPDEDDDVAPPEDEAPPELQAVWIWNEEVANTPIAVCKKPTPARMSAIRARLREDFGQSLDQWRAYVQRIVASDFLRGEAGAREGWRADIDFAIKASSCVKILEGKYDNRDRQARYG